MTLVDQDHIGWKSWKLIARTLSPTPSLFVAQRPPTYSQRTWENFGKTRGGVGKMACCRSTKAAISLKRVKIEEKLPWKAYKNSPTLFLTVPDPLRPPFPQDWGHAIQTQNCNRYLSQELIKLRTANLADTFRGSIRTKSPLNKLEKRERGRIKGLPEFF